MRSRERLIEVLETVNPLLDGGPTLQLAGRALSFRTVDSLSDLSRSLRLIARHNPSPHYRELASEALVIGNAMARLSTKL